MANSNGGDRFLYFLAGAGVGAVFALLFAPKSGRETREMLARGAAEGRDYLVNKASEGKQYMETAGRKAGEDISAFVDRSKEALQRQKEQLSAAFEAGKSAYRAEKGTPE